MNALDQLSQHSTIVADSGDLSSIARFKPTDATTNPSLILAATQQPETAQWAQELKAQYADVDHLREALTVRFGCEILQHVKRYVSTEVDPRASFDTEATIACAHRLIELYAKQGVSPDRVLIKIASTWEGMRAASVLEASGIRCNMTLLFNFAQAQRCADAGVTLISPFVGRIYDWYKARGDDVENPENDPGVASVRRIYHWYKANGYDTYVMGASFRTTGQIKALAGCDLLTIAPALLDELQQEESSQLSADWTQSNPQEIAAIPDESAFRWQLNSDAMAEEKLADGIRRFAQDQDKLDEWLRSL